MAGRVGVLGLTANLGKGLATLGLVIGMVVADVLWVSVQAFAFWPGATGPQVLFVLNVVGVVASIIVVGKAVTGRWDGVLLDERNRYSMSQLQTVLWSSLVLAGLLVMTIANIARGQTAAPTIPAELLAAMGIAATALVGTPIARQGKYPPDNRRASPKRHEIYIPDTAPGSWADLFQGEQGANQNKTDLGRVQVFFFTVVALVIYTAAIWGALAATSGAFAFPAVGADLSTLLGLSNAAYLANVAAPHG